MKRGGIDIGASAIRVVEVDGIVDGFARISALAVVPVPFGAIVNGTIADPGAVVNALGLALDRAKVNKHGVVVSVGSPDCALTSRITPAKLSPREREGVLRNDAVRLSSRYGNEELEVSAYPAASDTEKSDTVVAVAREEVVADFVTVLEATGLVPRALDLAGASVARAIVRVAPDDDQVHTIIDIGASKTTVVTRRGLHLRHVRTIETGGNDATRAIAAVTGEDLTEAELRKHNLRLPSSAGGSRSVLLTSGYGQREEILDDIPVTSAAEDAYAHSLENLVEQIALGVEALRRTGDYPIGLTLCGGGSQAHGLVDRIYARLGLPVTVGRPWAELGSGRKVAAFRELDAPAQHELMLYLAPAIGAALWREAK